MKKLNNLLMSGDQAAFDPDYDTEPLESFVPLIEKFFAFPKSI